MGKIGQALGEWRDKLDAFLHEQNFVADTFGKIEALTGIKRINLARGLIGFLALFLIIGYGASFLCCFIGFLYPAYASVKAIESKEKADDTKWLTYWVVYGGFHVVESFTDIFLFWIPLYYFFKVKKDLPSDNMGFLCIISHSCLFLIYCMVPMPWNGSLMIYYKIILPFFRKHEKTIDESIDQVSQAGQKLIADANDISTQVATEVAVKQSLEKND